ncbi:helix-hairpin-helix domain-containing protein [Flavobacterium restrictum]|uniref:Helix-hairpin-helix domain-containing protein n=2 Tax=Flavobacterium restrictum TaxID=2594428 RepID=A0A553EBU0_9FLAO|nr:helix-hairpin-helix domain-containing protein [Flavobacterium restrictum]
MISKTSKDYFKFSRQQRVGILFLFAIIISLQMACFFVDFNVVFKQEPQQQQWLSLQTKMDSLKSATQNAISKPYVFNPNFITDYKGYKLGMSVAQIDRLLAFRKQNKYVNSPEEFQAVTQISDSLLWAISPYFEFPDWVSQKKEFKEYKKYDNTAFTKKEKIVILDINQATQADLIKIYGIGEAISERILKQKETMGGFVSMEQMKDVWGLSPEVIQNLETHFKVIQPPFFNKIDINNASMKELSQFYYFKYPLAKQIVIYRSMNGEIKNIEDLIKIKGFPVDKAKIIGLYLKF